MIPVAPTKPPVVPSQVASQPAVVAAPVIQTAAIDPTTTPAVDAPSASLSTLQDILAQRNPRRKVQVKADKTSLKIGQDALSLNVTSSHDGYVYLVLLGSDKRSFYLLFPNGLDKENRVRAGQSLKIPRKNWQVTASGPAGTDHLLVMVTDSPRKLDQLNMAPPTADSPLPCAQ